MTSRVELSKERPRLLMVGDAVSPTGFARVLHNIIELLQGDYEIHHLGINYIGDPHRHGWKIYPALTGGDALGVRRLKPLVSALRPDLVFLLNDIWVQGDYLEQLRELRPGLKVVSYCPIDMGPIDPRFVERLAGVDRFVTYTRFGKEQVDRAVAAVRQRQPEFEFPPVEVIPHGVDTAAFHPLNREDPRGSRQQALRTILPGDPRADGAFVVLNANRNQPRKRIDTTIKGFALFAENKPANVLLYLHMGIEDTGWNVERLAERHGISDRLLLSTPSRQPASLPPDQLNVTFNAAAVGINTSLGEGWGLVNFEHAATRAAQVLPQHSSFPELWEGSALLVEPVASLTIEQILWEGHLVTPEGVAEALERLYEDPALLAELSAAAYRNATRPEYRWSAIAQRWHTLFRETLGLAAQPARTGDRGRSAARSAPPRQLPSRDSGRERPRVLIVGDAVAPTGFARVLHSLFDPLKADYEIHHLGVHYHGDPHESGWPIYPAFAGGDSGGVGRLKPLVAALRPQLVFLLGGLRILPAYMGQLRDFLPDLKVVLYAPVDNGPLDDHLVEHFTGVDCLVTYTQFGRVEFERAFARARQRRPCLVLPRVEVLPHGIDTGDFHPLDPEDPRASRRRAVRALLGDGRQAEEAFIVLNANRNMHRKRLDLTVQGFSLFARGKPGNVRLYLHTEGEAERGWNLARLAERHGVAERLLVSSRQRKHPGVPVDRLNLIYNASAVGLNTAVGEGWGLVSFEHGATRAAQVVPRHTACAELWEGAGLLVEPVMSLALEGSLAEGHFVSPDGVAEALERLYQEPDLLDELSAAAYRNATRPEYRWSAIARRWDAMFRELLGDTEESTSTVAA